MSSKGPGIADLSAFPPGPKLKKKGGAERAPPPKMGGQSPRQKKRNVELVAPCRRHLVTGVPT